MSHLSSASSLLLLHSIGQQDDGTTGGSRIELINTQGISHATFSVSSTVKGSSTSSSSLSSNSSSGGGTGRIDLLLSFGPYVVATFVENSRIVIYSITQQSKQCQSTLPERARAICVDPLYRYLIVGSATGRLRIYALATGSLVADIRTHHDRGINAIKMDRHSKWLITGGEDGVVSVYDFASLLTGALARLTAFSTAQPSSASSASLAAASALIMSISDHSLAITGLHISAGNMLLTASKDGSVRLYNMEQAIHSAAIDNSNSATSSSSSSSSSTSSPPPCLFHHTFRGIISSAVLDENESTIYVSCKENIHWINIYNPPSNTASSTSSTKNPSTLPTWRAHAAPIVSLLLLPGSSQLMSLDGEGMVKQWDCSRPTTSGVCTKHLMKRNGCKNILFIDRKDWSVRGAAVGSSSSSANALSATGLVATQNTYNLQSASQGVGGKSGGGGVHGPKEAGWVFPPLNQHPHLPVLFVPIALNSAANTNQEMKNSLVRVDACSKRSQRKRAREIAQAMLEVDESMGGENYSPAWKKTAFELKGSLVRREDMEIANGVGPNAKLVNSLSKRDQSAEIVHNQMEKYALNLHELYQTCVENVWKDLRK